jgi:hypothetical protein
MGKKQPSKMTPINITADTNKFALLTNDGKKKNKELQKNKELLKNKTEKKKTLPIDKFVQNKENLECNRNDTDKNDEEDVEFDINEFKKNILKNSSYLSGGLFCDDDDDDNIQCEGDEEKIIKDEEDIYGKNKFLNSRWTIWVHRNDCADWTVNGYQYLWTIDSLSSFWRFFNNFQKMNKEDNQYFIMRDKIKPIYEDNHNRKGGRCSLKLDCYDKHNDTDYGCEVMEVLCMLIMNETLIPENSEINGISYSIKNKSILIKLWTKDFNNDIKEKIPKNLINKISATIKNNTLKKYDNTFKKYDNNFKKYDNNLSIRYQKIEPEYEVSH